MVVEGVIDVDGVRASLSLEVSDDALKRLCVNLEDECRDEVISGLSSVIGPRLHELLHGDFEELSVCLLSRACVFLEEDG